MIDYDEGDKGEWTLSEVKRLNDSLSKEVIALRNENSRLKQELKTQKTLVGLWERAAKRKTQ